MWPSCTWICLLNAKLFPITVQYHSYNNMSWAITCHPFHGSSHPHARSKNLPFEANIAHTWVSIISQMIKLNEMAEPTCVQDCDFVSPGLHVYLYLISSYLLNMHKDIKRIVLIRGCKCQGLHSSPSAIMTLRSRHKWTNREWHLIRLCVIFR